MSDDGSFSEQEEYDDRRDDPESQFHDGRGIHYFVVFQPTRPPVTTGDKRRKNGKKPPTINASFYLHEGDGLADVIESAIRALDLGLPKLAFKLVAGAFRSPNFTIKWSLLKSSSKDMQMNNDTHYDEMIVEAMKKSAPEIRLYLTENDVPDASPPEDAANEETAQGGKKRKMTDEEATMAEAIVQLKSIYNCSDQKCSSPVCYLGNPTGAYLRLTPMHLTTWASAILAQIPGVDTETPPAGAMFGAAAQGGEDADDVALLARRRLNHASSSSTPTITINNDLAALATIAQMFRPDAQAAPPPPPPIPRFPSPTKPSDMEFGPFCIAAKLPDIAVKLEVLQIAGPHLLEYIENQVLDEYLLVGERAALRWAEAQWKKGLIR
ncbi:hypothetical protein C8R46DRAFT_1361279 [Mycena filopes]|nr:hypothetical protein C8R46DRAFT_1361279 [Mycena filopes]